MKVDWSKDFKAERKIDWADVAQSIHDAVTMDEVIALYAPEVPRRNHRCPCPFHNGKDFNFSYTRHGYRCFVCNASGDAISFVKDIRNLSSRADAMKLLNADLHLGIPIGTNISEQQNEEIERRRAESRAKQKRIDAWWDKYHALMDEWIECDKVKRTAEPMSDEWIKAIKQLEIIGYELDSLPEEPR